MRRCGAHGCSAIWVNTLERLGYSPKWRTLLTTTTFLSQRAEPLLLWLKASTKRRGGVGGGQGETPPQSGIRRGGSPSPAPSRVEGRRACLRSRESLLPAAFATCRCLNPVLAAFPRPRSSNRTCRFPASGFQSRSCLRPGKSLRPRRQASETIGLP